MREREKPKWQEHQAERGGESLREYLPTSIKVGGSMEERRGEQKGQEKWIVEGAWGEAGKG